MTALVTGQRTLAELRLEARQRADRVIAGATTNVLPDPYANSFVPSAELNNFLNAKYKELYRLMVTTYGNYYFVSTYSFVTDGTTERYPLPRDHFKLIGVDWQQTPGNNTANVTLKPFPVGDRNRYSNTQMLPPIYGLGAAGYQQFGDTLWLKPPPAGGQTIQLLYVPRPQPLIDTGTVTMNGVQAGDTLTINDAVFTAVAFGSTPSGTQFVVGGTGSTNAGDTGTALSLTSALNASSLGGLAGILTAQANGTVVTIALTAPATITWAVSNTDMVLSPSTLTGNTGNVITWSNILTGYAGWEEYLIVGAAILMLQKEESDPSALLAEFAKLEQDIKRQCDNRDEGAPATVTDVYANGRGGWGNGGPSGFGWGW